MTKIVRIWHRDWSTGKVPRVSAYEYETDRTDLEQIFRDNNAVDGSEVNVRMNKRSLSVGDIVEVGHKLYYCEAIGWSQTTKEEVWPHMYKTPDSQNPGPGTTTTSSSQERTQELPNVISSLLDSLTRSMQKLSRGKVNPPRWFGESEGETWVE